MVPFPVLSIPDLSQSPCTCRPNVERSLPLGSYVARLRRPGSLAEFYQHILLKKSLARYADQHVWIIARRWPNP